MSHQLFCFCPYFEIGDTHYHSIITAGVDPVDDLCNHTWYVSRELGDYVCEVLPSKYRQTPSRFILTYGVLNCVLH